MRGGRVVERVELVTDPGAIAGGERDVLQAALSQFYELRAPPAEINLPVEIEDVDAMEEWLSSRAGRRVRVLVPQRGDKRALVELATRNAELSYRTRFNEITAAHFEALETLRSVLGLPSMPRRIECFDISTIQGSETVASMVVCEDGRMKRTEYRKFRIRGLRAPISGLQAVLPETAVDKPKIEFGSDDFAAMREVVQRRYRAVLEAGGPFPDLILIDGGKGQLSAAYEALESIGLANLVAVGIAKKEELLFTRDRQEPLVLPESDPGAAADSADPRRGPPLRGDVPPQGALDARPAVGAGQMCRASAPRRRRALLTRVRQPGRRAARHARGAGVGRRREGRGRGHRLLRAIVSRPLWIGLLWYADSPCRASTSPGSSSSSPFSWFRSRFTRRRTRGRRTSLAIRRPVCSDGCR